VKGDDRRKEGGEKERGGREGGEKLRYKEVTGRERGSTEKKKRAGGTKPPEDSFWQRLVGEGTKEGEEFNGSSHATTKKRPIGRQVSA